MSNHYLAYRPLLGGTAILAESVGRMGTLGFFATSGDGNVWLVSAAHTLHPPSGPVAADVYQPIDGAGAKPVARTLTTHVDLALDVAAARLESHVKHRQACLGIGTMTSTVDAVVGMRVIKAGSASAVTEGVVSAVTSDLVTIEPIKGYPPGYNLCDSGDSGAAWLDVDSRRIVGVHVRGNDTGAEVAHAAPARAALKALGLTAA